MKARSMALTAEPAARCHRDIEDPGREPGLLYLEDGDYDAMIDAFLATLPAGAPLWLFAYGSLIWKPEFDHAEERIATAMGWHRAFCIQMTRWRGSLDRPGLMMGLMRGGQCRGVAYRLPRGDRRAQLGLLFRREMTAKPPTYLPRPMKLATALGPLSALGFAVNPAGRTFAGRLSDEETARTIAAACGHLGSGADYLFNTVANLEARGIHDRYLWRLQALVAREIVQA